VIHTGVSLLTAAGKATLIVGRGDCLAETPSAVASKVRSVRSAHAAALAAEPCRGRDLPPRFVTGRS